MTDAPPSVPEPEPEPEERQTTPFLVLQFFVFPMAIVAACVAVFVVFGLISSDAKTARDHLADVRRGGGMFGVKRWQAAFAFASSLDSAKAETKRDPELVKETLALFEESKNDDPRVRRYLALALGRMRDPAAVPALLEVVRNPQGDPDGETVVHAVLALGVLGDPAAVPDLIALASQPDAGLRKVALHSLRTFDREDARIALRRALDDSVADVRWNAALGLARWRDPAAAPVIAQMLDRGQLASVPDLTPDQANDVVLEAVNGAALQPTLERLRDADPDLKVREAARRALAPR